MEYVSTPMPVPAEDVRELVALSVDDPLAPFALRPDKQHILSDDGRAAVGFRKRCGLIVVGGDPVGDPLSWASAVDNLAAYADTHGHGLAVLGAGERAAELWREKGLSGLAIGRDVVLRPTDFALVGRRFRNLRQAVSRSHNLGVRVETYAEADVPASVRLELRGLLKASGKDNARGFSMTLGRPFAGDQPDSLILVARDADGRMVACQRYLRAGQKDLSLDVPVRALDAPNGVDERLIAEAVEWAAANGFLRVSLAFAPFPELFAGPRGAFGAVGYRLVHVLDPLIKVEPLYRYLRKFHAFDQQRHVMLRWRQLPRTALALLLLEFGR